MSLRGTSLRSRSRLACLTLAVGLAVGVLAPGAAASTSTPEPMVTATATATPAPTGTPTPEATATSTPEPVETSTPEATAPPTAEPTATAAPIPPAPAPAEPTDAEADRAAYNACVGPNDDHVITRQSGDVSATTTNGIMTVVVPEVETVDCLDSVQLLIWALDYERPNELDGFTLVALDVVEIPSPHYGGGTFSYPVTPGHIDASVTVLGYVGEETGSVEYLTRRAHVTQPGEDGTGVEGTSGFDACAAGLDRSQSNEPFTVDAVGGAGTIEVMLGKLTLADCFDEVTFRVLVKSWTGNDEQQGVELGPVRSDATFDGATVRGTFPAGRYFVVVLVSAVVDGEESGLFQVFDPSVNIPDDQREPIVVTAATASTVTSAGGRHLAATGVDGGALGVGGAALMAGGLAVVLAVRRRRSAPQQ